MNNENIKVTLKIRLSEYLFNIKKFDVNFIIAKVMLDRLYEFPDITIEEIAYLANTTPSSVTKFCKRIGYNGFTNIKSDAFFQNNNLEYISNHHTTPKEYYDTITNGLNNLYDSLYLLYDHNQIDKIAKQLSMAKKVCIIVGMHGFATANFFEEVMRPFDIIVYEINRNADLSIIEDCIHETDMCFIISLTGEWVEQRFSQINPKIMKEYQDKIVILTMQDNLSVPIKQIVSFPPNSYLYSSNIYSSSTEQSFFILLAAYLSQYKPSTQ